MLMRSTLRLVLVAAMAGLFGCGDGPAEPEIQAQALLFSYACDTWSSQPDLDALVLADLSGESRANLESAVRRTGGRVVHRFEVPLLRVAIRAGDIPRLPGLDYAHGVTRPSRLDVPLLITYSRPVTESDTRKLLDAGALEAFYLGNFGGHLVSALVPDASIPRVRRLDGITHLRQGVVFCSTGQD